jgi:hypothetical protein
MSSTSSSNRCFADTLDTHVTGHLVAPSQRFLRAFVSNETRRFSWERQRCYVQALCGSMPGYVFVKGVCWRRHPSCCPHFAITGNRDCAAGALSRRNVPERAALEVTKRIATGTAMHVGCRILQWFCSDETRPVDADSLTYQWQCEPELDCTARH